MRLFWEIWIRSGLYVISAFFVSVGVMFFQNPEQFQILGSLPPVLITVQLVLEYIPSAGLFSIAFAGFYIASMNWKKKGVNHSGLDESEIEHIQEIEDELREEKK